jgi:putative peptidoglycan lipid II flippase
MGLAAASDIGIGMQATVLAVLLHRKRMVSMASLDYRELGRCLLAGSVSGAVVWAAIAGSARVVPLHGRMLDGAEVLVGGLLWLVLMDRMLDGLGSALPGVARKRLGLA